MVKQAFHGGAFFEAIGVDFADLAASQHVINADVLDAWFDPSPRALQQIREYLPFILRTSPPAYADGLVRALGQLRGVPPENLLVGGGSSDLIFSFFPSIIGKKERALFLDPMYGEYQHILEHVAGATLIRHRLLKERQFRIDLAALLADIERTRPTLVVLVNPNSPTGQYWSQEHFYPLLERVPEDTLVVVDETYIEYVDRHRSLERDVLRFKNLVVIKSMSKVYALSGLRVGYLAANAAIIARLAQLSPPWAVSLAGQIAAIEALNDEGYYQQKYQETHRLRAELIEQLGQIPQLHVYPSVANFVLVELLDPRLSAQAIVERLKRRNIYIRNADSMSAHFRDKFLRITVKARTQQERIVAALRDDVAALGRCSEPPGDS
jgi:histidinol-phosphate aminotransferase